MFARNSEFNYFLNYVKFCSISNWFHFNFQKKIITFSYPLTENTNERGERAARPHLIAHQAAQRPGTLPADPAGDAAGPYLAGLGDHDVAVAAALDVMLQDVLRELRALPAARGTVNDHHGVALYQRYHLELSKKSPFRTAAKLPMI